MRALIVYHTRTGHTRRAAEDIAEGLKGTGLEVRLAAATELSDWNVAGDAVLIVGSVHAPHLLGSELAVRLARRLVEKADRNKSVRKMLGRVTFYVIARPTPDACGAFFARPHWERTGNERPIDDDRDGKTDEDGPEDLNGDGLITMMRVADPSGTHRAHAEDPRVLIRADAKKNERGRWSLYVEGRDNDADEKQGEDPPGGVALDRNFTFRYPYFEQGAGPHQVSEVESRAVADFAFAHPNIALVLSFAPQDNLMQPWKAATKPETGKIKTSLLADDAPYFDFAAKKYKRRFGDHDPPESTPSGGSFGEWAYFHYGRWSFICRGWWLPKVDTDEEEDPASPEQDKESPDKEKATDEQQDGTTSSEKDKKDKKKDEDKRGLDDLNALRWFAREKIDGFVPWQPIEHPDYPDKKVEVGGLRPFLRLNPPADRLEPLAKKHWQFLRSLVGLLPQLAFERIKTEPLGDGVWRITASVANRGYLPTASKMGQTTGRPHPLQIELEMSEDVTLATGPARRRLPTLDGRGGKAEQVWVVVAPQGQAVSLRLRVWSPSVGEKSESIELQPPKMDEQKKTE